MRELLEEFWYGNISPFEQSTSPNSEIKDLMKLMGQNHERLNQTLNNEQKETFEKYCDCAFEMHGLIEKEVFIYAFRLGGRMAIEMLYKGK